jgi:hypothetical protein
VKVDKRKFDAVLGKMLGSAPLKRSEAKPAKKKRKAKKAARTS